MVFLEHRSCQRVMYTKHMFSCDTNGIGKHAVNRVQFSTWCVQVPSPRSSKLSANCSSWISAPTSLKVRSYWGNAPQFFLALLLQASPHDICVAYSEGAGWPKRVEGASAGRKQASRQEVKPARTTFLEHLFCRRVSKHA